MMCEPDSGSQNLLCPRCEKNILLNPLSKNAISNIDRKTIICISCGKEEGMINWLIHTNKKEKIDNDMLKIENRFRRKIGGKEIE